MKVYILLAGDDSIAGVFSSIEKVEDYITDNDGPIEESYVPNLDRLHYRHAYNSNGYTTSVVLICEVL